MSKIEDKIAKLLRQGGFIFKREVTFSDLHGVKNQQLRFDFGIYQRGQLILLIEADGQQHFYFTPFFHKNRFGFNRQREWDRQKNKYCLLKNIPLIRVPYWDFDKLTLQSLFKNQEYRVKSKYHNDELIKWRGN